MPASEKNGRNCVFCDFDETKLCRTDFSVKSQFSLTAVIDRYYMNIPKQTYSYKTMFGYESMINIII